MWLWHLSGLWWPAGLSLVPFRYHSLPALSLSCFPWRVESIPKSFKYDFEMIVGSRGMRQGNRRKKVISYSIPPPFTTTPSPSKDFYTLVCYWAEGTAVSGDCLSWLQPAPEGTPALLICCFAQLSCGGVGLRTLAKWGVLYLASDSCKKSDWQQGGFLSRELAGWCEGTRKGGDRSPRASFERHYRFSDKISFPYWKELL